MVDGTTEVVGAGDGGRRGAWRRSVGPGIITASVVFGPGSLLTSSQVGATYRYELLWLLAVTAVLMGTYTAMAARIGVVGAGTPCQLAAARAGRPTAVVIGATVCLICASFQYSNNVACAGASAALGAGQRFAGTWLLVLLNGAAVAFLFAMRDLYRWIERLMMVMVGVMLLGFLFNLLRARPDVGGAAAGLIPGLPEGIELGLPRRVEGKVEDPMFLLAGLVGTTFSVAAALYQGTLVREKGWRYAEYRRGIVDAIAGITVLAVISAIIMCTAASVLTERPASIGDLAGQLEPLFGSLSHGLFCLGMLAAALSSFLVNAMIGGTILADGLGMRATLRDPGPRLFTVGVLVTGMAVGIGTLHAGKDPVGLIIFAQAITVLGNPLMAGVILWLANRRDVMGERRNSAAVNVLGVIGLLLVVALAARVAYLLILKLA